MKKIADLSLGALVVSCFVQVGAQLYAIVVVARTVSAAPPRSLRILSGDYAYDSRVFWETAPAVTALLFLVALATNWKSVRRSLLVGAFTLFLAGGALAGLVVEPEFAELIKIGYQDSVDPVLQDRAASWFLLDCAVWCLGLAAGVILLVAFKRPFAEARRPT